MPKYEVALGPHEFYLTDNLEISIVEKQLADGMFWEPRIWVNGKSRPIGKTYHTLHKTKAAAKRAAYENITRTDGKADDPVSDLVVKSLEPSKSSANPPSDPKRKANT